MVLLKMRIKRTKNGESTHYDYPVPYYDAHKVIFGPFYESGLEEVAKEVRDRNDDDEFIVIGVDEANAPNFLESNGKKDASGFEWKTEEITQAEAEALGAKWTKQEEKITDQSKVIKILAKVGRKETLTQDELNALNPDHEEKGINKTESFAESLGKVITAHDKSKGK
jgi:hypothetical protein